MDESVNTTSTKVGPSVKSAPAAHQSRHGYHKSGHYERVRALKRRGYDAIDGRTYAGRQAKRWRSSAITRKGGSSCPFHVRLEIDAGMFDLWLLLEMAAAIAIDAKTRRSVVNKRAKVLPKLHEQYQVVASRFARRCEALDLDKSVGVDLARRLKLAQQ